MAESHEIRIGTAERELAQRLLGEHFAAGRLTLAEFEERSGRIEAATTRGDLVAPFSDLPLTTPTARPRRRRGRGIVLGLLPLLLLAVFFVADRYDIGLWLPAVAAVVAAAAAMFVVRSRPDPAPEAPSFLAADPVVTTPPQHSGALEPRSRNTPSGAAMLDAVTLLPVGLVAAVSMVAIRFPVAVLIAAVVLIAVVVKIYRILTGGTGRGV